MNQAGTATRKVRCNEQRPRCSHCERLNLQCAWKSNAALAVALSQHAVDATSQATLIHPTWTSQAAAAFTADSTSPVTSQQAPAVDNFFDYAGFMWDNPEW
ncbi:hypothetical protein D6C95_00266 [Aureobasidium pullulans]|nr:hypothetical protein D6C95_00266 [Aureobasidium pullulans]